MKNIVALLLVLLLAAFARTADAQTATPTPTLAPLRLLTCANSKASVVFSICGVRNCTATVTVGKTQTVYPEKRKKQTDGSLVYTPAPHATKSCTFNVSALRYGSRHLKNKPSCARSLQGALCAFQDSVS